METYWRWMAKATCRVRRVLAREDGQGTTEYAILVGVLVVIAIIAPLELRVERAVASGFSEVDVRRRIARQITDADRIEAADVVFSNDSTPEVLHDKMLNWWKEYEKTI